MPRFAGELVEEEPRPRFGGELVEEESSPEPIAGEMTVDPREEQSGFDAARGAIEAINQGTTLGFGDEIVAGLRAAIDPVAGALLGEESGDQDFGDRYQMYLDDQRGVLEDFAEENPWSAMGLEIGGAILSPANIAKAPALLTNALKGRRGGQFAQAALRPVTEGAIYGAGTAEDDRLEGAMEGAAAAGLMTGALRSAGRIGRGLTRNRFAEEGVPLNFQEGALGDFYRDYLGRAYGGSGKIREQSAPIVGAAKRTLDRAEDRANALKLTIAREKEAAAGAAKKLKDEAGEQANLAAQAATDRARNIRPSRVVQNTDALNLDAFKKSVPAAYRDSVTEIGAAGAKQVVDAVDDAYSKAWGDVRFPPSWRNSISNALDEVKGELDEAGQAKVARIQRGLRQEPGLKAQQIDQLVNELIPATGGVTQESLQGLRQTLRSRLSPDRQKALLQVDAVYPNYLATIAASAKADSTRGVFSAQQLATEARRVGGRKKTALENHPLGKEARAGVQAQEAAKKAATSQKEQLTEQAIKLRRTAAQQKQAAERQAKVLVRTQARRGRQRAADVQGALDKAKENYRVVKSLAPPDPENISGLSAALTTKSIVPQIAFQGANLASGSLLARALASRGAQKTLAGQTRPQKAIEKWLEKTELERALAQRGISRYTAGTTGD